MPIFCLYNVCWRANSFNQLKLKSLLFDSGRIVRWNVIWDHFIGGVSRNFEMIYRLIYNRKAKSLDVFSFYFDRRKFMIFYKRGNRWKFLRRVYWTKPFGAPNNFFSPWTFEIYIQKYSTTFCGVEKIYIFLSKSIFHNLGPTSRFISISGDGCFTYWVNLKFIPSRTPTSLILFGPFLWYLKWI